MTGTLKDFLKGIERKGSLYVEQDASEVRSTIYTQSRARFIWGCLWECFCVLLAIGALTVGIGCLVTADQEKDNGEWLQISTGILIIILVFPLSLFLIVFLPHVFFTAIYVTETDISLPRSIFLLRTMVPLSSISKLSTETSGSIKVVTSSNKNYWIPGKVEGLAQLLWFIIDCNPHIRYDEFVDNRISIWKEDITSL